MPKHSALGWMQGGKTPPEKFVLDRIQSLSSRFILAWRQGDLEQGERWILFERCGDPLWQECGVERKARYDKAPYALTAGIALAIWAQCEGLHWWGEWPDAGCFSEAWCQDVQKGLREEEDGEWRRKVQASIREHEALDVYDEAKGNEAYLARLREKNPEFCEMLDNLARDEFGRICRGRTLFSVANKGGLTAKRGAA